MAISAPALASWGLLSDSSGGVVQVTQVLQEMEVTLAAGEPLAVELEAAEIRVQLSDGQ